MEFFTCDFVSGSKVLWSHLIVQNESINDMDSFSSYHVMSLLGHVIIS